MVNATTPEAEAKSAPVYRAKGGNTAPVFERVEGVLADDLPANVTRGFDDPSLLNIIHHAFDGRSIPVPRGLTEFRLKETFPFEDFIPAAYRGKRVWYTDESQVKKPKAGAVICPLSPLASPEVQADVEAMGYTSGICDKQGIGSLVAHMVKHRKFDRDFKEFQSRKTQEAQAAAFIKLAEGMTPRGPGRPPKERDE